MSQIHSFPRQTVRPRPPFWPRHAWQLAVAPLVVFIALPLAALFLRISPADLLAALGQESVRQALSLSLWTSLVSVLVTIVFGTPVAYYLSHGHYRYRHLLDTLIDLPTVLPPAVAGVGLLMAFGRRGLLGGVFESLGIILPFTSLAVILAQVFIAAPLYIKAAVLGFSGVDCELRRAAALDGASRWQTFRYIMVPMAWTGLLSGIVMTWARALGEFGATIIFAGNFPGRTQTMPLAIYIGFEIDLNAALALSAILVLLSTLVLVVVKNVLHRTEEADQTEF